MKEKTTIEIRRHFPIAIYTKAKIIAKELKIPVWQYIINATDEKNKREREGRAFFK